MASRYAAAGEGPPAGVLKEGTGRAPARILIADGHGTDLLEDVTRTGGLKQAKYEKVPPNRYYITFQICGKISAFASETVQEMIASRVATLGRVPDRPKDRTNICDSDYMEYKHQLALVFEPLTSLEYADPVGSKWSDLVTAMKSELKKRKNAPLKTYPSDKTYRDYGGKEATIKQGLCDLYDRFIHIHYPGDRYVDNRFTPTNYMKGNPTSPHPDWRYPVAGASGLLDRDMLITLKPQDKFKEVAGEHRMDEAGREGRPPIENFYMASVFPTLSTVRDYIDREAGTREGTREGVARRKAAEEDAIRRISSGEGGPVGKTRVSDILTKPELIPKASDVFRANGRPELADAVAAIEPPADAPVVLMYPVCRSVWGEEGPAKRAAALAASASLEQETAGGKRRTYRKKRRVRKSTRRTRQ
jgi:hypothetical protein